MTSPETDKSWKPKSEAIKHVCRYIFADVPWFLAKFGIGLDRVKCSFAISSNPCKMSVCKTCKAIYPESQKSKRVKDEDRRFAEQSFPAIENHMPCNLICALHFAGAQVSHVLQCHARAGNISVNSMLSVHMFHFERCIL